MFLIKGTSILLFLSTSQTLPKSVKQSLKSWHRKNTKKIIEKYISLENFNNLQNAMLITSLSYPPSPLNSENVASAKILQFYHLPQRMVITNSLPPNRASPSRRANRAPAMRPYGTGGVKLQDIERTRSEKE